MRYEARTPDDSVNVSPTHPLREAVVLLAGISAALALIVAVAGYGVDLAVRWIPTDFEMRVFGALPLGALVEEEPEGEIGARFAVARRLLLQLAEQWPEAPYSFRLGFLPTPEVNAVAVPGGWVLVTEGLLREVESENELAMVLGHELGHFRHRDHLRGLGRGLVWALALSALVGHTTTLTADLTGLGGELASRSFDRSQEEAADRFGLELLQALFGHVASATDFFRRLELAEGSGGPLAIYLSTHPGHAARRAALIALAAEKGWPSRGELVVLPPLGD